MKLLHYRGRLYCEVCFPRCVGYGWARNQGYAVTEVKPQKGLECHRCNREGLPAIPPRAKRILAEIESKGYSVPIRENKGGGDLPYVQVHQDIDYRRMGDGFHKSQVDDAKKRLAAIGLNLDTDTVDALLCASQRSRL